MHILQLPDGEIFKAGTDKNEWLPQGKTIKVDVDTIIFCRKGTANIEIDLIPYEIVANTHLRREIIYYITLPIVNNTKCCR